MRPQSPRALLAQQDHRPWPLPAAPWLMAQSWQHLLFAHWPLPPEQVAPLLPPGLRLDTFDDRAWVAVVPFDITDIRWHGLPSLPPLRRFLELNVRTYVIAGDKPGVWFFSLDAAHRLAVEGARIAYRLPYFNAVMTLHVDGQQVSYTSHRRDRRIGPGDLQARYAPESPVYTAAPGSLEHWLTERYCLYAARRDTLYRGEIHHVPWPLRRAQATLAVNTVTDAHGINLPEAVPLLHYVRRLDVLVWAVTRVRAQEEFYEQTGH